MVDSPSAESLERISPIERFCSVAADEDDEEEAEGGDDGDEEEEEEEDDEGEPFESFLVADSSLNFSSSKRSSPYKSGVTVERPSA